MNTFEKLTTQELDQVLGGYQDKTIDEDILV
ncbi:bacteriocin [Marinifilum caeruleilacunae]|uniref:Bacteriocin n=1 Tax=Marinifilum caeruleilacunae TaxID=2499076 RepID=A0ABX1WZL7_9BACT|nr:bacteriocin [Marinifilum caeruleilacunae]NOU61574.1 bacteriocin [Marinifilum caeruleilacunae]